MNTDIIMTAYDSITGKMYVVHFEDEVEISEMTPWFWSAASDKYVTVPGYEAAHVYSDWRQQK